MDQGYQVITIAGNGQEAVQNGNALEAMFGRPIAVCCSLDSRLYITEYFNDDIRMLYGKQVTNIAGNRQKGYKDGNAHEAMFYNPNGLCFINNRLYVCDQYNQTIRMVYDNQVTTIAGNGKLGFHDGNALEAVFAYPGSICCSSDGRIYISDSNNYRVRMLYNNQVTTIAGKGQYGFQDGNALEAKFGASTALCCSIDGKIYVSDQYNHRIRMIHDNQVTTIAGNGKQGYKDGNALEAMFSFPCGVCCSRGGRLFVSDKLNHRIRMICNDQVTTIAGNGQKGFKDGNALEAMFHNPNGLCLSRDGKLYVADLSNNRIRMIYNDQHQVPFGFALLLDMKNTFSDCQISFNNINYHLHSTLINIRCPLLFDQSYFSLLQQSNISNKSFESFVIFLYSNTFTNQYNQTWRTTLSIKSIIELIFMIDLLMNGCKSILIELESSFTKQLIEMLTINQQQSMKELILDILPCIYGLKELIKSKLSTLNITTTANPSYIEHCYNILIDELKKKKSTIEQHMTQLQHNLSDKSYTSIMNDMTSQTTQIDTMIDDESMIDIGADLTELSKLAFYKTNISKIDDEKATIESSSISAQHLDEWTTPDFVIKLSNDDISYHVHKLILCGRWKYFCLMIESGLKEVSDNEMTLSDDWNKSRFEKMMKYIYLNEIEFDSLEDVEWLIENRKLYGITVDKQRNQADDEMIEEDASYGFEDLYEYCISALKM